VDPVLARQIVAQHEVVVDSIGYMGAAESNLQPRASLEKELRPQLTLIAACSEVKPAPVVVFISSRLVYGSPQYLPVDELHPLQPASLYALHKITAEGYLRILGEAANMPFCIFRLSNPYGPHQKPNTKGYGVINAFLQRAANNQPIEIFGDGQQRRDYIHVDDAIDAMLCCAVTPAAFGQTFNLGSGEGISLKDAAVAICDAAGLGSVRHRAWPNQALLLETGDYISDVTRLRSVIGHFQPRPFGDDLLGCLQQYRQIASTPLPPQPAGLAFAEP
jgi:nucleoside-diphosphate-sugar epimerase